MGTQVHKVIGYGLDKLKRKKGHIVDPRIDIAKLRELENEAEGVTRLAFFDYCRQHREELISLYQAVNPRNDKRDESFRFDCFVSDCAMKKDVRLDECVITPEYLNALLFLPLDSQSSWYRFDNTLDWVEETNRHEQRQRAVRLRPFGIYPYNLSMHRVRPAAEGVSPRLAAESCLPDQEYSILAGYWSKKLAAQVEEQDVNDLRTNWRCNLPLELVSVVFWFRDALKVSIPEFLADFRPLLAVYWQ